MSYNATTSKTSKDIGHYGINDNWCWQWCSCVECGVWHKVNRPTTADALCPRCKEELKRKFNNNQYTFRNEITG